MEVDGKLVTSCAALGGIAMSIGLPTVSLGAIALPLGLGSVAVGSIYGAYRIATKDRRKYEKEVKEKRIKWNEFWMGIGIKNKMEEIPVLVNIFTNDYGRVYSFINPIGLGSKDYINKEIAISEFVGANEISFEVNNDFVNISTIETELPKLVPFKLPEKKSKDIVVELGLNKKNEMLNINFTKIHSWLLAGSTRQW